MARRIRGEAVTNLGMSDGTRASFTQHENRVKEFLTDFSAVVREDVSRQGCLMERPEVISRQAIDNSSDRQVILGGG